MPAGYFNFTGPQRCESGATFSRQFTLYSNLTEAEKYAIANGTLTGAQEIAIAAKVRNLTGYTARMQVRSSVSGGTVLIELTTANAGITLGGTAGTVVLTIAAADTASLTAGEYYYDAELISGAGAVERILQGRFVVDPEVTR